MRLRDADRQQRQLLHGVLGHWLQQVRLTERQAAATAQATAALPREAAQLLQREAFERYWQLVDAARRQARDAEQAAWVQMRREQWQDLLEGLREEDATWKCNVHDLELKWLLQRYELYRTWRSLGQPAGPADSQQAQQAAPANGGEQALRLPHATVPPPMREQLQRQLAAGSKRKEPEGASDGEGEVQAAASPTPASSSTPPRAPSASSPVAPLPRKPSAGTSRLLLVADLNSAGLANLAASSLGADIPGRRRHVAPDWTLPPGFEIELYTPSQVVGARAMAVSGNSQVNGPIITYVGSLGGNSNVTALVDLKGRGQADYAHAIVVGLLPNPNGVAWRRGSLYIGSLDDGRSCRIYRLDNADRYALERRTAKLSDLVVVRGDLPTAGHHGAKVVRFGPDGKLYFAIGAPCNYCELGTFQATPTSLVYKYGSLYRMNPDGSGVELVASGIRNTVGFDWHPATGVTYFTDNGRDRWNLSNLAQTDDAPDCELNAVTARGQFFGFPYCHTVPADGDPYNRPYRRLPGASAAADPDLNLGERAMKCTGPNLKFRVALQAMGPHTAPLGMRFYRWTPGANFPRWYNNSIFIAQRGSWNREHLIGARVMRVVLDPADPLKVQHYVPFLCGGVPGDKCAAGGPVPPADKGTSAYNARPVDVQQLPDGSLLLSDNQGHAVYRISFIGTSACRAVGATVPHAALTPVAIGGTSAGCAINLGSSYVPRYRRCYRADVSQGAGRQMLLAANLVVLSNQLVLSGALLLPRFACTLGPSGWVGFGLPKDQASTAKMVGARVLFIQPAPNTPTGATVYARLLNGTSTSQFKPAAGLLARSWTLKSYVSGGALVTTFEFILPNEFRKAAIRANKIPKTPGQDISGTDPTGISFLVAFGDAGSQGLQRHWMTGSLTIPFRAVDIGAAVPSNPPVLNRGVGPDVPAPAAPPPPPSPPPPPPSPPPGTCAPGAACCLNGVAYTSCRTDTRAGFSFSQFYKVVGGTLFVGIKATTSGWIAWSYNKASPRSMIGSDAQFVRPCPTCPTRVSTPAFHLGDNSIAGFSTPTKAVAFTVTASGTAAGGVIWAQFKLAWPGGATIRIHYGGGMYSGNQPDSAIGMSMHSVIPPAACVGLSGGMPSSC